MNSPDSYKTRLWPVHAGALAAFLSALGLAGVLWSFAEPQYQDALGYYVPYARHIFIDPTDLVFRMMPQIGHPPLHALAVAAAWWVGAPDLWGPHLVSLLAAIAVLYSLFQFTRLLAGPRAGVASVAVMLAVPLFQSQARIGTPEMLVAAFVAAAVLALARGKTLWAGVWLIGAVLTKETAAVVLPLLALWAVWDQIASNPEEPVRRAAVSALHVAGPPLAAIAGWVAFHLLAAGVFLQNAANPSGEQLSLDWLLSRANGQIQALTLVNGLLPLLIGGTIALVLLARPVLAGRFGRLVVLGLLPIVCYLPLHALVGFPLTRYMLPALPPLVAVLVSLLARKSGWFLVGVAALTVLFGLAMMWRVPGQYTDPEANLSYQRLVERDQAITSYVVGQARRNPRLVTVVSLLPDGGFPYSVEFSKPIGGYVDRAFTVLSRRPAAPCTYALVGAGDPPRPPPGRRRPCSTLLSKGRMECETGTVCANHDRQGEPLLSLDPPIRDRVGWGGGV